MKDSGLFSTILSLIRILLSVWLMAYYLVPNTIWGQYSAGTLFSNLAASLRVESSGSVAVTIVAGLCMIIVGALFYLTSKSNSSSKEKNFLIMPIWLLLSIYFIAGLASLFVNNKNPAIIHNVMSTLIAVATGIACALIAGNASRAALLICFYGLLQGFYTIYYHRTGHDSLVSGDIARAGGTFGHPSGVYVLMTLGIPLATTLALISFGARKFFSMLISSTMLAALILTWYRGGMLAAALSTTCLFATLSRNRRLVFCFGACLFSLFLLVFQHRVSGARNMSSSQRSIEGRLMQWQLGAMVFKK